MSEDRRSNSEEDVDSDIERIKQEVEGENYVPSRKGNQRLQIKIDKELHEMLKRIQNDHNMDSNEHDDDEDYKERGEEISNDLLKEIDKDGAVGELPPGNVDIDELWKKYLMDNIEEDKTTEEQDETEPENPFSRKLIDRKAIMKNPNLMVPRASIDSKAKIIKTPIYDLLLEKTNFHTSLIQEYVYCESVGLSGPAAIT